MGVKTDKPHEPSVGRRGFSLTHLFFLGALLVAPVLAVMRLDALGHPFWVLAIAGANSLCAAGFQWFDKRRAEQERWRVPENFLHLLELLGGWPGSFVGQRLFRHKTVKFGYQFMFWLIVVAYELVSVDFLLGWRMVQQMRQLVGL